MARPVIELSYSQVAFVLLTALAIALNSGTQDFASSIITGLATGQNPASSTSVAAANDSLYYSVALIVVVAGLGYAFSDKIPEIKIAGKQSHYKKGK